MTPDEIAAKFGGTVVQTSSPDADAIAAKFGGAPEAMTERDKYLSSGLIRFIKGMKDPIDKGAQVLPRALSYLLKSPAIPGNSLVAPKALTDWLDREAQSVDADISESEKEYQQAQKRAGTGFDAMRLGGNIASPANALPAKVVPAGAFATRGKAFATGAATGAAGGAMQPVTSGDFWEQTAVQAGTGAAVGGPLGAVAQALVPKAIAFLGKLSPERVPEGAIEAAIQKGLADLKMTAQDFPPEFMDALRAQVRQGMATGRNIDVASAARKGEFEALGMEPMLGQMTRDPTLYARERNLRGVEGVGEPIVSKLQQQRGQIATALSKVTGNADEPYQAGERIAAGLRAVDQEADTKADLLYRGFRDLAPKDLKVPDPQRWAGEVMDALESQMVGGALPASYISRLNKIATGEFPLTPSTLYEMDRNARKALEGAKGSERAALGVFKSALMREMDNLAELGAREAPPPNSLVTAGTIVPERSNSDSLRALQSLKLGKQQVAARYGLQEEVPAVKAAVDGISGEDFVRRFVTGGSTGEVIRMGNVLRTRDPEAFAVARSQVGAVLQKAAFGADSAGDSAFRPDRFAEAFSRIGRDKLLAFFTPQEVTQLERISRVGAYIDKVPNGAVVNHSGTAAALMNILQKLPLGSQTISLGSAAFNTAQRGTNARRALAAQVPSELTPEAEAEMARLLGPALVGGGVLAAPR